ncbi:MAG: glycosyltransferase [Clostridia bacterium]|nr:glycosyltransferase [Clostridia bacterium]
MMGKKLISVIIPAYNSEKYIGACLDSLTDQINGLGEVIVVDDGSTDGTAEAVRKIAQKYECVRLLQKQNGGVSSARNAGLEAASGKYLLFCDADDAFAEGSAEFLLELMEKSGADAGRFEALSVGKNGRTRLPLPVAPGVLEGQRLRDEYLFPMIGPSSSGELNRPSLFSGNVWNHIFKREIIEQNGVRFSTELFHAEDQLFVIEALIHCNKLAAADKPLYLYFQREGSAVRSFNERITQNAAAYCRMLDDLAIKNGMEERTKVNRRLNRARTAFTIAEYIFSAYNKSSKSEKIKQAEKHLDREEFDSALAELDLSRLNTVYRLLYRCLKRKNYCGYMAIKDFRNIIYKIRH